MKNLSEDFCTTLEYRLTRSFKLSCQSEIRSLWCDGISPAIERSENSIDSKGILTKAWIGKNGQDEYVMTIMLGKNAIDQFIKGGNLIDSIPSEESDLWVDIDINSKTIIVQLK